MPLTNSPRALEDNTEYEICVPGAYPPDQVSIVEGIHQQFLNAWASALSEYLEIPVSGRHVATEAAPLTAAADAAEGGCLFAMALDPGPGTVWIWLPAEMVFRVLGILIGVPADAASSGRTFLTEIEKHILRPFLDGLSTSLRDAWLLSQVRLADGQLEVDSAPEPLSPDAGPALILRSVLQLDEMELPFRVSLPGLLVRMAGSRSAKRDLVIRDDVRKATACVKVEVEAVLAGSTLRISDLLALEPGHVLLLGQTMGAPLECRVNGLPKFTGELIESRDRVALLLAGRAPSTQAGSGPADRSG
jgi:flagellar motor switch protein FliM